MWLEALDLVLQRLKKDGLDFSKVRAVSGAGMQHGTVFWSHQAEELLGGLKGEKSLVEQLGDGAGGQEHGAFSHPHSPNWQDASTQKQCEAFDAFFGSPEELANVTGSAAHHVSWASLSCRKTVSDVHSAFLRTSDHALQTEIPGALQEHITNLPRIIIPSISIPRQVCAYRHQRRHRHEPMAHCPRKVARWSA